MKFYKYSILFLFFLSACRNNFMGESKTPQVDAFGEVNHVVVVCDPELWDGPLGDSITWYFGSAYPILPQPEPIFDLRPMSYSDLLGAKPRRELRNYLFIADLSRVDSTSLRLLHSLVGEERLKKHLEESKVSNLINRDVWARGQQLFYIIGQNTEDLYSRIRTSFPALSRQIREFDRTQIRATAYAAGVNKSLSGQIANRYQIDFDIPADWLVATEDDRGIWLRKETEKSSSNIVMGKIPYSNASQLAKEGLKRIRDTFSRTFVRTDSPGDYMEINDQDLPLFIYQKNIDGNYGIEARGVWETKIEFMGGPFQTYLIQTPAKDSLLYIDIFVYAPEMDKRNLIQQLEEIIQTVHFR